SRDSVEILTSRNSHPSTSWLEIVKTAKARHHVRRWIRSTQFLDSVKLGREILVREIRKRKLDVDIDRDLEELGQQLGYSELDKLLAAVGAGDLTHAKILNRLDPSEKKSPQKLVDMGKDIYATFMRRRVSGVRIQGLDNLMVRYARCCEPIPGDEIVGVVTRGRGVSVHRMGCSNLQDADQERLIEVTWDVDADQIFMVKLTITGLDRKGLLADLSEAIHKVGVNIRSGDFQTDAELARATLLIEVRNLNNLDKVLKAVRRVPNVQQVERYQVD
ncbi:hypothetical protein KKA85_06000, partial [bacterium]|nr:hypothetical protein [bacterium]